MSYLCRPFRWCLQWMNKVVSSSFCLAFVLTVVSKVVAAWSNSGVRCSTECPLAVSLLIKFATRF